MLKRINYLFVVFFLLVPHAYAELSLLETGDVGSLVQAYDDDLANLAGGITGMVKGNGDGSGYSAAVENTDYAGATHASRHAPNGEDPIEPWCWGGALTVGDATPPVASGYVYDCTGASTVTITDFYDSGDDDHSEFTSGKSRFRLMMNDADVTIDFSDNASIEGNANTDLTGHATQIIVLEFLYVDSGWKCTNLTSGMTDALTLAAKVGRNHNTITGNDSLSNDEMHNYTHYVTAAAEIDLSAIGAYHEFSIKNHTDEDVYIDPNGSEVIRLNGIELSAGNRIVGTNAGDGCSCEYYSSGVIACDCYGYEDAGS